MVSRDTIFIYMNNLSINISYESDKLELQKIFSLNKYDLLGTENLPLKSGVIFIYNHT